jgi:hypothetical protein
MYPKVGGFQLSSTVMVENWLHPRKNYILAWLLLFVLLFVAVKVNIYARSLSVKNPDRHSILMKK